MNLDSELLSRYAKTHCEDAFAELVRRHVNLVYSAALRQVNGDAHLAQDVAQNVFADLARKAANLSCRSTLTGWLYTSTHFAAAKAVRSESRRRVHEQEAHAMQELLQNPAQEPDWEKLRPIIDQVMHELTDSDRELLLMRYFESRRLAEIGGRLGLSEDAVRKRVERALEKLRTFLFKRGITAPASLAAVISTNAVQSAPAGLAATLTTGALAGTALATATAATLTKTIAVTTIQKTLIVATVATLASVGFYEAHQASRWHDQAQNFQQQQSLLSEQLEQAHSENKSLSGKLAQAGRSSPVNSERLRELLRLRGEVGVLRRQKHELEQTLAAAQAKAPRNAVASQQPGMPAPFQVQLVADEPGQDTEPMNYSASGANGDAVHVNKTPLLDYTAIRSVSVTKNADSGQPEINIELSDEGKELFAAVTKENLNKRMAIVMNGHVYAAPVVRSEIPDGKVQITGNFTEEEAQQLAAKVNEAIRYQ